MVIQPSGPRWPQLERALNFVYRNRPIATLTLYAVIAGLSFALAIFLRYEFSFPATARSFFFGSLAWLLGIRVLSHAAFRVSTSRWRFASTGDVLRLTASLFAGSILFYLVANELGWAGPVPRSVIMIEFFLTTYFTAGLWIAYRTAFERVRHFRYANGETRRVLLIGAGEAGSLLAREMLRLPTGYRPVGFVDDDRAKWDTTLHGVRVLGGTERLSEIAASARAQEIIIAAPSATPAQLRRVVDCCEATHLGFKVLPGISEVLQGVVRLNQLRDLRIEDLLGREPIDLQLPPLAEDLSGRSVLITGAAGSIGSELARQVALHRPAKLILLDQSETGLFYLELELREAHPELHLVPVIGDIVDPVAVERLFRDYRPSRVYHAAAYKHVSMMQINVREALRNNSFGTWRVGDAAARHGAEQFVLVSTDKAVNPSSVMGATKRLAELVVLGLQRRFPNTAFAAVRFGNVLGSSGSVIPIFKAQIESGKPITVTHPEATRYFMTIPEAAQLILHTSLLPEVRGQIAMLEMGEPVRIIDLARNLLRLSGIHGTANRLVFTGLHAGEKLHEELLASEETTTATSVLKVRLIAPTDSVIHDVEELLQEWETRFAACRDHDVLAALVGFFPNLDLPGWTVAPAQPYSDSRLNHAGPISAVILDQVVPSRTRLDGAIDSVPLVMPSQS